MEDSSAFHSQLGASTTASGTHTPEPWQLRASAADPNYQHIASDADDRIACTRKQENARRIVACVNACGGIDTAQLEAEAGKLFPQPRLLTEQRDELAAALRVFADTFEAWDRQDDSVPVHMRSVIHDDVVESMYVARAALAKVPA